MANVQENLAELTLDQLKRSRSAIAGVLTKSSNKFGTIAQKQLSDVTDDDLEYLTGQAANLVARLAKMEELNAIILSKTEDTDEAQNVEQEAAVDMIERIRTQAAKVERLLERSAAAEAAPFAISSPLLSTTPVDAATPSHSRRGINLPKFSGKLKDWVPFYDQFMASVDANETIGDVQKLNYLKASLQGEAAQILSQLATNADNYRIGLKLLIDQYANRRFITHSHFSAIFNLPSVKSESAEQLRRLLIGFDENLMALRTQGIPTDTSDYIWVH